MEFVRGIPADLDDDEFFDPSINNLLILDDLFSETGKDERITDLFTEGSHHRSLSVISINQNLYGKSDISQRRNSQYIVLYKCPVDQTPVMTLARQMYPGHTQKFMTAFEKATKQPYGHLVVDLKPFTPEGQRLKYGIPKSSSTDQNTEWQIPPQWKSITEEVSPATCSSVGVQTVDTKATDKGRACDDCGQLFDTVHDVQRHIKNGRCPEKVTERKRETSPETMRMRQETPRAAIGPQPEMERVVSQNVSCDDCGLILTDIHRLQTHVKHWCPTGNEEEEEIMEEGSDGDITDTESYDDEYVKTVKHGEQDTAVTDSDDDDKYVQTVKYGGEDVAPPINPEVEKWRRHFQRMAEGKIRPNHKGHWIVEDLQQGSGRENQTLQLVTPVAQHIAIAESMLKREKEIANGRLGARKRKRRTPVSRDITIADVKGKSATTLPGVRKRMKRKKDFSMRPPGIPAH